MEISILGSGMIVHDLLSALKHVPQVKATSIFVRPQSIAKGEALAKEHDIATVFTDYDELLAKATAPFVYVGLPNNLHYEFARKALLAGKNVILEKPFTTTLAEAQSLVSLAREKHLYLFEAVTIFYLPNYAFIRKQLPSIGRVHLIEANYSQYSSRYDAYLRGEVAPAFDPTKDGGALMDINIYCLNFVIGLFGKPQRASYHANRGYNGIDTSGTALLAYDGFYAICTAAKDSHGKSHVTIEGEKGCIDMIGTPNEMPRVVVSLKGESDIDVNLNKYPHRMASEFETFDHIYSAGDYNTMSAQLDTSLAVMEVTETLRASQQ